jgi:hypothetical protein
LLEKLRAEIEALKDGESLPHMWKCCKCQSGPYHIEEEAKIDDYEVSRHCIRDDCSHVRCKICDVWNAPRSISESILKKLPAGGNCSSTAVQDTVTVCGSNGKLSILA